jgi:PhnB protein
MSTTNQAVNLQLEPYLFFYGRCEEALEFYKKALGGTYELQRMKDAPAEYRAADTNENRVMHATFKAPGFSFMASDGRETKSVDPDAGNISLSIGAPDLETGRRIFTALAEGGQVRMPLENAFWGGNFGMLIDKFGVEWFMMTP